MATVIIREYGDSISNNRKGQVRKCLTSGNWDAARGIETASTYPSGPELADSTFWATHVTSKNPNVITVNFGLHDAMRGAATAYDYENYLVPLSQELAAANTILGYIEESSTIQLAIWVTTTNINESIATGWYNEDIRYYNDQVQALFEAAGWPVIDLASWVDSSPLCDLGADGTHYDLQDQSHMGVWQAGQIERIMKQRGFSNGVA